MKYIPIILILLFGCLSCENTPEMEARIFGKAKNLSDENSWTEIELPDTEIKPEILNEVFCPIRLEVEEMTKNKTAVVKAISISATNIGENDLTVQPELDATGMLTYKADLHLPEKKIRIGDTFTWKVPVSRLPIESDSIITQLAISASYRLEGDSEDAGVSSTPVFYYLTDEASENATLFTDKVFFKEYKGRLKQKKLDMKSGAKLGKLKKQDGSVEIITDQSDGFNIVHNGVVLGRVIDEYEYNPRYSDADGEVSK